MHLSFPSPPKFPLGRLVITPNALDRLEEEDVRQAVLLHASGDWGTLCDEDRHANEQALRAGSRLFSVYSGTNGQKLYVITEADRSVTTVLLPEDY